MPSRTENAWFTYYYWLDDARAPDFARTVDIHRKPGYDPVELFLDPKIPLPKLKIAWRLLQKKLGFRMLMDVIPLDATLVKGSHGRRPADKKDWPVFITEQPEFLGAKEIESTDVFQVLLRHFAVINAIGSVTKICVEGRHVNEYISANTLAGSDIGMPERSKLASRQLCRWNKCCSAGHRGKLCLFDSVRCNASDFDCESLCLCHRYVLFRRLFIALSGRHQSLRKLIDARRLNDEPLARRRF